MTACDDDARLTGPVSLFCGVETARWQPTDFARLAAWARGVGVTTLFVKAFEVGSAAGDLWYGGLAGLDAIQAAVSSTIGILWYGFSYGPQSRDFTQDVTIAQLLCNRYGRVCLDLEGSAWGGAAAAAYGQQFADALTPVPGKVYLSHPANFADAGQTPFMAAIAPCINVYMPMAYSDYLVSVYQAQVRRLNPQACVQPTLDLSQEFGPNDVLANAARVKADGCPALSLWYEHFAQQQAAQVQAIVSLYTSSTGGGTPMSVVTNSKREIADFPDVSQMEAGESEYACGFFSVGECLYAGPPGKGAKGTPEQVDQWADAHGGATTGGVSIDDMHWLLAQAGLHYWDTDISPSTVQAHDIATVKAIVSAGYAAIVTVAETSVFDLDLGGNPYAPNWTPSGNHVLTCTGVAADGNLLFHDTAAIVGGIFGRVASQPRRYRASSIEIHWCTCVQLPWCAPIPSGDPLTWPAGFNAQVGITQGGGMVPTGWKDDGTTLVAPNGFRVVLGFRSHILGKAWDAQNVPLENEHGVAQLEESNPSLGGGTQQTFKGVNGPALLGYTPAHGVMEEYAGQELFVVRQHEAALLQQVKDLQTQLQQAGSQPPVPSGVPQAIKDDVAGLLTLTQSAASAWQTALTKLAADCGLTPTPTPTPPAPPAS